MNSRLGKTLADLIAATQWRSPLGVDGPGRPLTDLVGRLDRYRLAWYSARRGRAVLRANIAEALLAHTDRHIGGVVYDGKTVTKKTEPTWCDACGVPYPCHTRRMLTRPPLEADQ